MTDETPPPALLVATVMRNGEVVAMHQRDRRSEDDYRRVVGEAMTLYRKEFYGDDLAKIDVTIRLGIIYTPPRPSRAAEDVPPPNHPEPTRCPNDHPAESP